MKWYKFDKKIQQNMSDHESELDIDALWGDIEADVDVINASKKKRRWGVFWLFLTGLLLLGSGVGYLFLNENNQQEITNTNVINSVKQEILPFFLDKKDNKTITQSSKGIIEETPLENIIETTQKKNTSKVNRNNINSKDIDYSKKSKIKTNTESKNNRNRQIKSSNNLVEKALTKKVEEAVLTTIVEVEKQEEIIIETKELKLLNTLNSNSLSALAIKKSELNRTVLNIKSEQPIVVKVVSEEEDEKQNKRRKMFFSASLQGSLSFTDRSLSAKGDTTTNNIIQLRQTTERTMETSQLGLLLHVEHKSGIELISGINYTQINERFEYNTSVVKIDSIEGIQFYYVNVNGDTTAHYGEVPMTTTKTFRKKFYNKYRMIDVPVLLGYRKGFGDFSIGAQAGVFLNLKMNTSGRFLKDVSTDIDIKESNIFKSSVGLSYYIGATADFKLMDNWSVYVSPFIRYFPKDFASAAYELEQKYVLYGGTVGVRYSFQ